MGFISTVFVLHVGCKSMRKLVARLWVTSLYCLFFLRCGSTGQWPSSSLMPQSMWRTHTRGKSWRYGQPHIRLCRSMKQMLGYWGYSVSETNWYFAWVTDTCNSVSFLHPAPQTHPDFPKKPLTPYFRFFMEKRAKYAKIHPEMSNLDLTKILSKKYKELPEKKKVRADGGQDNTTAHCDVTVVFTKGPWPDLGDLTARGGKSWIGTSTLFSSHLTIVFLPFWNAPQCSFLYCSYSKGFSSWKLRCANWENNLGAHLLTGGALAHL